MRLPSPRRAALHLFSFLAAICGLSKALRIRRLRRDDYRLFILEYHDVAADGSEFEGTIAQGRFRSHLQWLQRHFDLVSLGQAIETLRSHNGITRDLVAITFDDGYEGNFTGAWPVLEGESVSATIFLTTGFLDGDGLWFDDARRNLEAARTSPGDLSPQALDSLIAIYGTWPVKQGVEDLVQRLKYLDPAERSRILGELEVSKLPRSDRARPLSWSQVRTLVESGLEFGPHTVTHPILSLLDRQAQQTEILGSRQRIEEEIGVQSKLFAYPNGSPWDYNSDTLSILEEAGFEAACTTQKGSNRPSSDPLQLYRIGVGSDPLIVLEARLSGLFDESLRRLSSKKDRLEMDAS